MCSVRGKTEKLSFHHETYSVLTPTAAVFPLLSLTPPGPGVRKKKYEKKPFSTLLKRNFFPSQKAGLLFSCGCVGGEKRGEKQEKKEKPHIRGEKKCCSERLRCVPTPPTNSHSS